MRKLTFVMPSSHQWIFITDTVDAVYRPEEWFPEALLDRLAEVVGALPVSEVSIISPCNPSTSPYTYIRLSPTQSGALPSASQLATPAGPDMRMRRPLLQALRQIDSVRDLVPFFSTASISSYEAVYHSAGVVDWPAVEHGLLEDLFDGR